MRRRGRARSWFGAVARGIRQAYRVARAVRQSPRRSVTRSDSPRPRSHPSVVSIPRRMNDSPRVHTEVWMAIARHSPLGILCDLDGTLVPFASSPEEARPDADAIKLVTDLASLPGLSVAIVS